jgi:hypothetical protein
MAGLPPDGTWLIQQSDGIVSITHRYTEEEIFSTNPSDVDAICKAQQIIYNLDQLTPEQKCFAHFWCGYFYAHATGNVL